MLMLLLLESRIKSVEWLLVGLFFCDQLFGRDIRLMGHLLDRRLIELMQSMLLLQGLSLLLACLQLLVLGLMVMSNQSEAQPIMNIN